jgi:hypothetical protein
VRFLFRLQGAEEAMKGSVKTLALAVPLGVVGSGVSLLHSIQFTELPHYLCFEVAALVAVDAAGDPKAVEPVLNKCLGHSEGLLVPGWDGLAELRKHVSHDQDVLQASTGQFEPGEIDCQDVQRSLG